MNEAAELVDDVARQAIEAMPMLDASTRATSDIHEAFGKAALAVQVLEDLAFSAHVLALNTTAFAARSAADRGCLTVLAREARTLAIGSAKAAATARTRIEGALEQSDRAVTLVLESGKELDVLQAGLLQLASALRGLGSSAARPAVNARASGRSPTGIRRRRLKTCD